MVLIKSKLIFINLVETGIDTNIASLVENQTKKQKNQSEQKQLIQRFSDFKYEKQKTVFKPVFVMV